MRTGRTILTAVVAASALLCGSAHAQGAYVGAMMGQSQARESCDGVPSCDDKDTGWRVFGGYEFNPSIAVELGYADLGRLASVSGTFAGVPISGATEVTAWDLVGVFSFPIQRFILFAKAGVYRGETESRGNIGSAPFSDSETNTGFTFGLGLGFDILPNLRVLAQWSRYNDVGGEDTGEDDVDFLAAGLRWRF